MTVVTSEVKIMAIACAWSHRGKSYFMTTCRSADVHEEKDLANFEYDFGSATCKKIIRSSIFKFSCEVSPIADEYNMMRKMF